MTYKNRHPKYKTKSVNNMKIDHSILKILTNTELIYFIDTNKLYLSIFINNLLSDPILLQEYIFRISCMIPSFLL